jgi:elongator complex protein 2
MAPVEVEYIAVGGNRIGAAADWDKDSGLVAYGAGTNIALWSPSVANVTFMSHSS